jgi:SAM-dependent methyltransferase
MPPLIFRLIELPFRMIQYYRCHVAIPGIKPEDLVLEVGSGDNPKPRSNVLVEKFIFDDQERVSSVEIDRPIVCGDILNLPFKDKAFDFIICTHLLEHIEDIEGAISELMRVAKRGYIETPSDFSERMSGYPFHHWYVENKDNKLVFTQKNTPLHDPQLAGHVGKAYSSNIFFRLFSYTSESGLTRYSWSNEISYEVHRDKTAILPPQSFEKADVDTHNLTPRNNNSIRKILKKLLGYLFLIHRRTPKDRLEKLLACPICKADLSWRNKEIICTNGHLFQSDKGVPILLKEKCQT